MGEKLEIRTQGMSLKVDLSNAIVFVKEPVGQKMNGGKLNVNITEEAKKHDIMGYTTDVNTMQLIFQNKTFRSSSLSNTKLNDAMEKQRVGVSEFAGSRFITCFTHENQENVHFWTNYGGNVQEEKVFLQFINFAVNFFDCVRIDFARVKNDKLCFFNAPEYGLTINSLPYYGAEQYDLRVCIDSVSVFDVEYVSSDSEVFTEDNSGQACVDFGHMTGQENSVFKHQAFNTTVLGKHKANPWGVEKETRILCTLSNPMFKEWDYIDLQLHPEIFRGLRIVLSPWDDGSLRKRVEDILSSSELPQDIASSIEIKDSVLKGTLNF